MQGGNPRGRLRTAASSTLKVVRARVLIGLMLALGAAGAMAQETPPRVSPLHRPFDEMLELYVRDGFVYYNALKIERSRLDRYIASLNGPVATEHAKGSPEQQRALWINAYNALVLRTVIDNFPIRGKAGAYPSRSIRQIPGAFEKVTYRVAGRSVTLDAIYRESLVPRGHARISLGYGRG